MRVRLPRVLLAIATTLVVASCSGTTTPTTQTVPVVTTAPVTSAPTPTTASAGPSANAFDLEGVLEDALGSGDGGISALTLRSGVLTEASVGVASADGTALTPDTPMRVGSISKTLVATLVMQLVDEGLVDLDAPVSTYLPEPAVGGDVAIRWLLGHRSGIPSYTDGAFIQVALEDRSYRFTPDEVIASVADRPVSATDQAFFYSNTNYILLGQLVEVLTGQELNAALERRITGPLGLENTFFSGLDRPDPDDIAAGWAQFFDEGTNAESYVSIASSAWAAGSLVSTPADLAVFLGALAAGDLTSIGSLGAMVDTVDDGYGFGLFAVQLSPSVEGVGHNGSIPGFHSTMAIDIENGDLLVVLTNHERLIADDVAAPILNRW